MTSVRLKLKNYFTSKLIEITNFVTKYPALSETGINPDSIEYVLLDNSFDTPIQVSKISDLYIEQRDVLDSYRLMVGLRAAFNCDSFSTSHAAYKAIMREFELEHNATPDSITVGSAQTGEYDRNAYYHYNMETGGMEAYFTIFVQVLLDSADID